jgi:hypothetical protein
MDCYFHSNVPSIAPCTDCRKPICATCRDEHGSCPGCRLAAKVDAATAARQQIGGQVPPRPNPYQEPHANPNAGQSQNAYQQQPGPAAVHVKAEVATMDDPLESRALVALGYPLWPLALLSLFDRKHSRFLRRQAIAALGFNAGFAALWGVLSLAATVFGSVPFISAAPEIMLPLLIPLFLVASVYFGVKTWQGQEVRVPIVSDWLDERMPA